MLRKKYDFIFYKFYLMGKNNILDMDFFDKKNQISSFPDIQINIYSIGFKPKYNIITCGRYFIVCIAACKTDRIGLDDLLFCICETSITYTIIS